VILAKCSAGGGGKILKFSPSPSNGETVKIEFIAVKGIIIKGGNQHNRPKLSALIETSTYRAVASKPK